MKKVVLGVGERTMWRRDIELPGKRRRRAERLLVKKVPPAPDGLPQGQARRDDVEVGQEREPLAPRVPPAERETAQEPAVNGQPSLPHRDNLLGKLSIVIEVERHVVEPRPDQRA